MRHGRDVEWMRCPQGHEWEVEVERSGDGRNEPRTWELLCDRDGRCAECGAEWLGWDDWSEPEGDVSREAPGSRAPTGAVVGKAQASRRDPAEAEVGRMERFDAD